MAGKRLTFARLVRAGLRRNRTSFLGVAVSILVATTLITGLGVLVESGIRGGIAPERYAVSDVVVGGRQSLPVEGDIPVPLKERAVLPAGAAQVIATLPGVSSVVADVTVRLAGEKGILEGHPWQARGFSGFEIREGKAPSAADEVVVTASSTARIGDTIPLSHGGGRAEYRVVGVVKAPKEPVRASHVFLSEERIAQLDPRGGAAQVLGVSAEKGTSSTELAAAITARFPDLAVRSGSARGDVEFTDSGTARSSLVTIGAAFAGTCLLVTMFIVSGTLSLSVQSRRREFALLRAVGASPSQIHRLITREVFTVGSAAALLGVVPGYLLAVALKGAFVKSGVIPGDFELAMSPAPACAAVMLVLLAGWSAARIAASRPAKIDPIEALREAANGPVTIGRGRLMTGIGLGIAGLMLSGVPTVVRGQASAGAAAGASIILIISLALLGPVLVGFAVRSIGTVLKRSSAPAFLASKNAAVNARRLASAITPIALGIALGLVQLAGPSILASEAESQARAGVLAQLRVSAPGGLSNESVENIRRTPGVTAVNPVAVSQVVLRRPGFSDDQPVSSSEFPVQGIDPGAAPKTLDLKVREGSLGALAGEQQLALSSDAQQMLGLNVGDTVAGNFGDGGPLEARVVAIYERGLGFGDVTMSGDVVRSHTTSGLSGFALVEPGNDVDATRAALSEAGFVLGGGIGDPVGSAGRSQQGWVGMVALIVILGYIAIAVVNTLMMATGQRSREFALMQLVGASRKQVRSMMRREAAMVALFAAVFGVAIAVPPLVGMSVGVTGQAVPHLSLVPSVAVIISMCSLALVALAVSTHTTLRIRPIQEIGSRE
ncbi:FtsX-like permease family protein [Paenarthrobacter sp. NPDC089316]|uniref:ABC transporter permease n=1 Tax=unclassified Paenarthrobacter TaxID=2634190 RepID=UPI00342EE93C